MTELLSALNWTVLASGLAAGLLLGVLYLLGLWWTVRRAASTGNRALLAISFVIRAGLLLLALYFMAGFGLQLLVAALAGFLLARWLMTRLIGTGGEPADDAVT